MSKAYLKIFVSFFILICSTKIVAQELDSLVIINSRYDSILHSSYDEMDKLFYKFQRNQLINNLGPFGSPFYFNSAFFLKNKDILPSENKTFSRLKNINGFKPFTNITYINASRKEQQFSIDHIQEFGRNILLDFNFRKLSSPGAFINQEANNTFFKGKVRFLSRKENYELRVHTKIIRNFYQENGGLSNLINYENSAFSDAQNYQVNLINSNSFRKFYRYGLEQYLDLFKINGDSCSEHKVYMNYSIDYSNQKKVFNDNDPLSTIYNEIFLDSISYVDSIYTEGIENRGGFGLSTKHGSIELFGEYDLKKYEQINGVMADFHNSYVGIYGKHRSDIFYFDFESKFGIDGYREGDINSQLKFSIDDDDYRLDGDLGYFLNEPDLKYVNYVSNHFYWVNTSLNKESNLGAELRYRLKKMKLCFAVAGRLLNNMLYFDSLAQANQNNGNLTIISASLAKNYKLLNFYFKSALIYQATSDELLFPLPEFVGRQIVYYQKQIFKGVLKFQVGVGVSYSTDYFGYAYMPAINEFYVQSHTNLGEYPKFDVFINTHLRRAQIFLKYEHINAGGNLSKAYVTPLYPILDKSLKFGVSWNMFD